MENRWLLRLEGERAGGGDLVGFGVGAEGNYGEVDRVPLFIEIDGDSEGCGAVEGDGFFFAEQADDGGVLKEFTGIFAGGDVGAEIFFR